MNGEVWIVGPSVAPGLNQAEPSVTASAEAATLHDEANQAVLAWTSRVANGEPWPTIEQEAIEWSGGQPDMLWLLIVAARSTCTTPGR